jgi:hypothetical protein
VDVWNVPKVLARKHLFRDVLTKFHDLFSNVTKKGVAGQRPMSIIMKTGHSPRYMAIAAPNLIECVPTSSFLNLSLALPIAPTASRNASMT